MEELEQFKKEISLMEYPPTISMVDTSVETA